MTVVKRGQRCLGQELVLSAWRTAAGETVSAALYSSARSFTVAAGAADGRSGPIADRNRGTFKVGERRSLGVRPFGRMGLGRACPVLIVPQLQAASDASVPAVVHVDRRDVEDL